LPITRKDERDRRIIKPNYGERAATSAQGQFKVLSKMIEGRGIQWREIDRRGKVGREKDSGLYLPK